MATKSIFVVGAGLMGSGTQVAAQAGYETKLYDIVRMPR